MDTTTLGFRSYFPFSVPLWERTVVTELSARTEGDCAARRLCSD